MKIPKLPHMPNVKGLAAAGKSMLMAHRTELLLGASLGSTIGSVILAAKGGYEARGVVEQHEAGRRIKGEDPLTTREKAELTWQCYLPAAGAGIFSLGSTTALHMAHLQDKRAMASMAFAAVGELKSEIEKLDEDNTALAEKNANAKGVVKMEHSDGEIEELYLVRDMRTGRDIWSNKNRIETALIEVAHVINGSEDCELGHFYHHAGFSNVPDASDVGWSGVHPEVEWGTSVRDDGRPVRTFKFRPEPQRGIDGR